MSNSSLSCLADNLAEGLHKYKYEDCKFDLEYMTVNDRSLIFKCKDYKKNYEKEFDEDLTTRFQNTYKFCDGELNKFCLMLRKCVYPYEYMDSWQRLNEMPLPVKKEFCSSLTMENITDADYKKCEKSLGRFQNTKPWTVS